MGAQGDTPVWSPVRRVLFRFLFAYLLLYNVTVFLNAVGAATTIARPYLDLWHAVVPWVGKHVWQMEIVIHPSGSGDKAYDYVEIFCFFLIAVVAALVWTLVDRKRRSYPRPHDWLTAYVRFGLAATMIVYGAVKVIKAQFPDPSLGRLLEPVGDCSPMGLLWTFMGASTSYNVFSGAGEMLGGLLLTTRRTTLLGALVCIGVVGHVVMLNYSYDVPVKLLSSHLLAMSVWLTLPHLRRLVNFFVLNRATEAAPLRRLFRPKWLHRGALALRTLAVIGFAGLCLYEAAEMRQTYGDLRTKPPLYGIWTVEEFAVGGKVRPPLLTDETRWRRLIIEFPGGATVQNMSDVRQYYAMELNADQHTLTLSKPDKKGGKSELSFEQPEPDRLLLTGTVDGKDVRASLRRFDEGDFLLRKRGFHWISEYPFNR